MAVNPAMRVDSVSAHRRVRGHVLLQAVSERDFLMPIGGVDWTSRSQAPHLALRRPPASGLPLCIKRRAHHIKPGLR